MADKCATCGQMGMAGKYCGSCGQLIEAVPPSPPLTTIPAAQRPRRRVAWPLIVLAGITLVLAGLALNSLLRPGVVPLSKVLTSAGVVTCEDDDESWRFSSAERTLEHSVAGQQVLSGSFTIEGDTVTLKARDAQEEVDYTVAVEGISQVYLDRGVPVSVRISDGVENFSTSVDLNGGAATTQTYGEQSWRCRRG